MFKPADEVTIWNFVAQSRRDLITYLETLSPSDWNTPTQCDGWAVRDILAHLILEYHYQPAASAIEFIRSGLRINSFMKRTAVKLGRSEPEILLDQFRAMVDEQDYPSGVSPMNVLADLLVHEQDIREALRQPKHIPQPVLQLIFTHWEPTQFNFGEKITGIARRIKGLKFVIIDLGLTKGEGEIIKGTAQDLLLAVTGRPHTLERLSGPGVVVLRNRLT